MGSLSLLQGIPNPGIEPGFPALQVDLLPTELSGKPFAGVVNQKWFKMVRVVNFIIFLINLLLIFCQTMAWWGS